MKKLELGKKINDYLVMNRIPQKLLASKSNMTENQLNLSLNSKRKLLADEYIQICDALCVLCPSRKNGQRREQKTRKKLQVENEV